MRSVRIPKVKTKNTPWRVRDFKMFFNRRGIMRQPRNDKKTFQKIQDDKNGKNERKFFRCKDQNSLIGECPKPPKDKNQRAFIGGSWSDSGEEDDEKANDETCLMAQASKLLHMDIFDPSIAQSYRGNLYTLVIVDDYSRMDHSREFDNEVKFGEFCNANSITHYFSAPRTPQSNDVIERKIRTLQEMSRIMLNEQSLP
nr:retrovirus-related Pol polyprotein from transposon TNT 1-94 [Tanacetum cinerariifolium]GEX13135.1 retrovirus-related Pol polyprotein from transposon TNT 1-94 [Tanacetum cinerariifolium]